MSYRALTVVVSHLVSVLLALASTRAIAQEDPLAPVVSIVFVGDIMLDDTPGRVVRSGRDPFAHIARWLHGADVRIGNLESIVATTGTPVPDKPYTFRAHPRVLQHVKRYFDAVSLANNHAGDYGPKALLESMRRLDSQGIRWFGAGRDLAQAHEPLLIERHGLRIALLGYNEFLPRSFEADVDKPGIAWSEDEHVRLDIQRARSLHRADLVIPVMHWGWENESRASERQRSLARLMLQAGADAVVGGHPHVIQDVEVLDGKPIFYSLGNFVFNGFRDEANNTGWLLRLELDREGVRRWRTYVARLDREGLPHPSLKASGQCGARGLSGPQHCADR
jgi:poly-gamma-glutamate synthesis protein (capsule biosynthesis protein)